MVSHHCSNSGDTWGIRADHYLAVLGFLSATKINFTQAGSDRNLSAIGDCAKLECALKITGNVLS